jgi:serine/threonine-protein kinase
MPSLEKAADPMIGQLVGGRFRVTGVLGEGGMGIVYVGEQQMGSTVRKVAIKTLHQHLSKDPSVNARFYRECGVVAQLEHPNTIKFYDFGETADGALYIAMEFVAGRPLADVIRDEGPLEPERVIRVMRQACGALDEAHAQGIIHRDLKPENIILVNRAGEKDVVKVLDFGIAARSESSDAQKEQKLTQQGMVLGTPPYMSPEQFTGKALDARSDVYSLGVMVYEMLTGRLPFDADTPWQWATQHMTAQPIPFDVSAPTKNIPPAMRQAILKSLSKDREQRQASARDFFAELSEGGRMTVDAPPPAAAVRSTAAHASTAAMDQVPQFHAAPPVQASPAYAPIAGGMGTPAGIAAPAPPPRAKSGGGKGVVVGLAAVGGVLLITMAVLAARSLKKPDDQLPPLGATTSTTPAPSSGPVTIAPVETAPPPTAPAPVTSADVATGHSAASTAGATKTKANTTTGAATGATSSATPPAGGGGAACDACIQQAGRENIPGAVAALRSCSDDAKKAMCTAQIRRTAPSAAKHAALNGNCGQAKAIVAAAQSVGAPAGPLTAALANSSCK